MRASVLGARVPIIIPGAAGEAKENLYPVHSDIPFSIADLDGDGRAELLVARDKVNAQRLTKKLLKVKKPGRCLALT